MKTSRSEQLTLFSFRPKLNEYSEELAKKVKQEKRSIYLDLKERDSKNQLGYDTFQPLVGGANPANQMHLRYSASNQDIAGRNDDSYLAPIRSQSPKKAIKQWEILYKVDVERRREKEKKRKEEALMKELEDLKECTFKPKLVTSEALTPLHNVAIGSMYERNLAWQMNKERRLEKERKKESKEKIRECTFRPMIKASGMLTPRVFRTVT